MHQADNNSKSGNAELFGSFHLADAELALSIRHLQEVVDYPKLVTPIPLAPAFLVGMFNLRGTLVPIVHLGPLLGMPDKTSRAASKVAIVDLGNTRVGLLFDDTGEVLRVDGAELTRFEACGHETPIVSGALKLDGGNRILYVLAADALPALRDLVLPQAVPQERALVRRATARARQHISFRVGATHLALTMEAIQEIVRVPALQTAVAVGELCLGEFNLRGNVVPLLDFARFLDPCSAPQASTEAADAGEARRVVILRRGEDQIGLLVDEVESIVGQRGEDVLPIPSLRQTGATSLFTGCICQEDRPGIMLLDAAALLGNPAIKDMMQGSEALFHVEAGGDKARSGQRSRVHESYVTFRLDRLMGIRIDQLCEIIEYTADLTRPPGLPDFIHGVLDLRHALVAVIDLRKLYGMQPCADLERARILITERDGNKYGLVVDTVENILAIDMQDKMNVPGMLLNQIDRTLSQDMRQMVELSDQHTLLLLDAEPLVERLAGMSLH